MTHGKISLKTLRDYAKKNPCPPHRKNDPAVYGPYKKKVLKLIEDVSKTDGWYVWFNSKRRTATYIGQTANRKTSSLRTRLYDELTEELVAIWLHANCRAVEIYTKKYKDKYNQGRAAKKSDADSILWISYPGVNYETLDVVEDKLIERFKPKANVRITRNVDWPASAKVVKTVESTCR